MFRGTGPHLPGWALLTIHSGFSAGGSVCSGVLPFCLPPALLSLLIREDGAAGRGGEAEASAVSPTSTVIACLATSGSSRLESGRPSGHWAEKRRRWVPRGVL